MLRLGKAQKKIIVLGIAIAVFLLCFYIFVYLPQKNKLSLIKEDLASIEAQIAQINRMTGDSELAEAVRNFDTQLRDISTIFSFSEEEIIGRLSKEAKNLKIEIEGIKPLEKQLVIGKFSYSNIEELPISMQLSCEFKDLAGYLKILKDNFPALIKITQLEIKGSGEGNDILSVNLKISTYLFKGIVKKVMFEGVYE